MFYLWVVEVEIGLKYALEENRGIKEEEELKEIASTIWMYYIIYI